MSGLLVQQSSAAPNQIDGTVFRDYDADGLQDSDEPGVANVTVFVIDAAGNIATTTTDNLGDYAIVNTDGAPASLSGDVRIEFTLPVDDSLDFMQPGTAGGTTVQFANIDVGATAVVGINNPAQYSQPDPQVALARFEPGQYDDAGNAGVVAIKSHAYSDNGTAAAVTFTDYADVVDVGTIYGLAYEATSGVLWGSTYIRRGASVGSTDSTGTIYKLTGAGAPGPFLDLPALGVDTGTNPHPNNSGVIWIRDNATFPVVGKVGLGDIDVSDDGQYLYAVNLFTRELVIMPLTYDATGQPVAPTSGSITSMTIPVPAQCNGNGVSAPHPNDWRPFALKSYDDKLYVGGICSAQSMLEAASPTTFAQLATIRPQVQAHVFEFDPDTNTFGPAPIMSVPMDYARERVNDGFASTANDGDWLPWNDDWRPSYSAFTGGNINANPQPMLVDIEFDGDGFMTLGFRDRYADQAFASNDLGPLDGSTTTNQRFGGDVLLACLDGTGNWQLESGSSCTNGLTGETRTAGTSDDSGPSSPEFYHNDQYLPNGGATALYHDETAWGALALLHGSSEIMVTKYDSFGTFEAGTIVYDENDGDRLRAVQVYPSNDSFGKAGGIGDIELLPDPAPIELGSRIWSDSNGNGIQDPGEGVPDTVTVELWADTNGDGTADTQIGTTTTDPTTGEYYFNNANVTGDIERNTVYEIRIDMTQLSGYVITTPDEPQPANGNASATDNDPFTDVADSDAVTHGSVPDTAVIIHTTGGPGSNNHGLDFGFIPTVSIGSYVWLDEDGDGLQDASEPGIPGADVDLFVDSGGGIFVQATDINSVPVPTLTTGADGLYFFDDLPEGSYRVQVTVPPEYIPTIPQTTGDDNDTETDSNIASSAGDIHTSGIFTLNVDSEPVESGTADGDGQDDGNDDNGNMTVDFGFIQPLTLGSYVWGDLNYDGLQDGGEPGIENALVQLWVDDGSGTFVPAVQTDGSTPVPSQTTGSNGQYFFTNLPPGEYQVRVTPPVGYGPTLQTTADDDPTEDDSNIAGAPIAGAYPSGIFTLTVGGEPLEADTEVGDAQDIAADDNGNMTVDFGFVRAVSMGSFVWEDVDGDGIQNVGEPGIPGANVSLWFDTGLPATYPDGTLVLPQTTGLTGEYFFDGLPAGNYRVQVTPPAGFVPTLVQTAVDNNDNETDSNIAAEPALGTFESGMFTLSLGGEPVESSNAVGDNQDDLADADGNMTVDFGFIRPLSVGSLVWIDQNGNGLQDSGEPGIDGVQVTLWVDDGTGTFIQAVDINGTTLVPDITSGGGVYFFDNLPPGEYYVEVTNLPAGHAPSPVQNANSNDDIENDSNIADVPAAGVYQSGVFSLSSGSEPDETGGFGGDNQDDASETSGNMTVDFGFVQSVSIGSYVWLDENGDGLQDASEPALPGADVALFIESGGTFVAATYIDGTTPVPVQTTGANGLYFFDNLPAGNYRVRVTPPIGYAPSLVQTIAANDDAEDDSNIATDLGGGVYESGIFALTVDGEPGESGSFAGDEQDDATDEDNGNMTVDFGFIEPVSIGSFVWEDLNNNGLQDGGEPGIESALVELLVDDGTGNFVAAVQIDGSTAVTPINTGPNGQYFFDNLPPGRYQVQVTPPASYVPSGTQNVNDDIDTENDSNIATSAGNIHTSGIFILVSNNEPAESGVFAGDTQDTNDADGNMTVDFGFVQVVSIGSYVWVDENGDGIQDAAEPAIVGADVTLFAESGGVFIAATDVDGSPVLPQTTGADGLYFFDGLPAGNYRVQVSPPAGYVPSLVQNSTANDDAVNDSNIATNLGGGDYESATFTLTVGGEPTEAGAFAGDTQDDAAEANGNMTVDFGFIEPLSIGSFVWVDEDGDGLQDVGEPGIENTLVELLVDDGSGMFGPAVDVNGNPIIDQTTGPNGQYNFTNLPPGGYQVQVTPPAGFTPSGTQNATGDDDTANDSNIASSAAGIHTSGIITLSVNGEPTETGSFAGDAQDDGANETDGNMTVDFGFIEPVSIGSFVWEDLNNNGLQNVGEPGIANALVELLVDDGTGSFGPAVDVNGGTVGSQTTAADGQYHFTNLPPGRYQVRVTPPADYVPSGTQNAGNDDDAENDSNIAASAAGVYTSGSFTLASNTEPAEAGTFDGDDQDDGANEPDGNMTVDFGFVRPLSLGSFVWWDQNGDGLQDAAEPGIANALVELLVNDGTGTFVDASYIDGTAVPDQTTAADGLYFFDGLPVGEYQVRVTPPAGYVPSLNQNNSDDDDAVNDSNIATSAAGVHTSGTFTLSVGSEPTEAGSFAGDTQDDAAESSGNMTVDFGFITPVSIGSFIWEDLNNNGLQDVGEPGIENAAVALLVDDGTGTFVAAVQIDGITAVPNQTTGVDGQYFFDNLPPGRYQVQVTPPATYVPSGTQTTAGDNDTENDSNIATSAAGVHTSGTFTLISANEPTESGTYAGDAQDDGANETDGNMTVDFGFFQPVAVGNVVWDDDGAGAANFQDGEFDFGAGEQPFAGVTIELYQAGGTPGVDAPFMSMVTNGSGEYLFDMIPAGDYFLHIPANQFVSGGILASYVSSPGNDAVDVDADDDVNENGVDNPDPRMDGISSNVFTLTPGGEPTGETGQGTYSGILPDNSVNMTIDFGLFELLTLGNVVWIDDNNNGVIDAGESGVPAGVVLYLLDGNGDPVLHPVTGQPISTTTAADGSYDFLFLYPGNYIVQLGPENFQPGGLLEGYIGSTGSSDPDANSDDADDNGLDGTDPTVDGILTNPITLDYHSEPDNGADTDNNDNTNLTVDFGVTLDPTAVSLSSFTAVAQGNGEVAVEWTTESETNNFGFQLFRSDINDFTTSEMIYEESSVVGNGPGKTYNFTDNIPNEGVWYYWLVDIDTDGIETVHGPVEVNTSGVNTVFTNFIFLPMVVNN